MQCPVCKVKFDFEISPSEEIYYDCSHCQSSLLFNKGQCEVLSEGQPVKAEGDSLISEERREEDSLENQGEQESYSSGEQSSGIQKEPAELPFSENNQEGATFQNQAQEESFIPDEITQVPELSQEEESAEEQQPQNLVADSSSLSPASEESQGEIPVQTETPTLENQTPDDRQKEDFKEVAQFANTQNMDRQGVYLYDLVLSEINSQAVREKVLSVLEDKLLILSSDEEFPELKDGIKNGKVTIPKISPVKAYVIITSLMGLPLDITWRQNHIADS